VTLLDSSNPAQNLPLEVSEPARIRSVFGERVEISDGPLDLYSLYIHQERQLGLVRFFRSLGLHTLSGLRILDLGCGSGGQLRRLVDFGAEPANCFGVDLFRPSLTRGRTINASISFVEADGARLPFSDASFDLTFQATVFSSVLDPDIQRRIAGEIYRVLRPGGRFIWYDFAYSNPRNPNVRGISRRQICRLLSRFQLQFQRATLAPPLGRRAVRFLPGSYRLLNALPFLRTHYFCFARRA
jgi:ubiquinone/menaquinone biosynthesis C-methylase UbiE